MKTLQFGIIGCGFMGREFASAASRWFHLSDMDIKPEIVAVCDANEAAMNWFTENIASIKQATCDYKELLGNPNVKAVYVAVPNHLHEEFYCAAIKAGKHLMAEKPFGIDKAACDTIMACIETHPDVFVRCSSEFPFFPGMQQIGTMLEANAFGEIFEVNCGFLHSSDMNPDKPINWKRIIQFCGEYGCMGDLGIHVCHMPFRAGIRPVNVRAVLSNIVPERPEGKTGKKVPCETWDNSTLLCEAEYVDSKNTFPLTFKIQRITPGQKNTWYVEVLGTKGGATFSTKHANAFELLEYTGGQQAWQHIDMGNETAFKSITADIFECGFTDIILQMWAAFLYEFEHGKPISNFAGCVTPAEAALSHTLFTAALESNKNSSTVNIL